MSEASGRATIALLGNPNAGKSTLFNVLTGTHQRVGNWPGVTVERKSGRYRHAGHEYHLVDLPGLYSLQTLGDGESLDQEIAQQFVASAEADLIVNIVDASSLERGLFLTTQLLDSGVPMIVALNMVDVAERHGQSVDIEALQQQLDCPVVPIVASKAQGLDRLLECITSQLSATAAPSALQSEADEEEINRRYLRVADITAAALSSPDLAVKTSSDYIDAILLNRVLAFPLFLAVMYLMFMFTINIGGAFIDLFDGVAGVLFVEAPRQALQAVHAPAWLITLLADGLGGGVQLVASFVPLVGSLFLFQSFLESTGYMARAAFIVDLMMRSLGLAGKSFVPLIVGFGCNVPAVMGARTLERHSDRLLTVLMAPFMSCGARLTVYVLFASVFFPENATNIIFALYLIGILLAVLTALAIRHQLVGGDAASFVMELPNYHWPNLKSLLLLSWQRLKGFVLRAGKAIVAVVVILSFVNSLGTDGSFGNQDSEKSMLSQIGKQITPLFEPIGVDEDNWPATVGIFTGVFAKEVVVGTLDALYGSMARERSSETEQAGLAEQLLDAFRSVPENLSAAGQQWDDPLGVRVGDLGDAEAAAEEQGVQLSTMSLMAKLFDGPAAAFAYLLFVLLYMPCVATLGAIYKELGWFWAAFSAVWNTALAYAVAIWVYQGATFSQHPVSSGLWIVSMLLVLLACWFALIYFARKEMHRNQLIPVVNL